MRHLVMLSLLAVVAAPLRAQGRAQRIGAVDPSCERILKPAEAGSLAGRRGVHFVGYDPRRGALGSCNYAMEGDTLILVFQLRRADRAKIYFQQRRRAKEAQKNVKAVPGLGDEAFTYGEEEDFLYARKGRTLLEMNSFHVRDPRNAQNRGT